MHKLGIKRYLLSGVALFLAQLAWVVSRARGHGFLPRYEALFQWDSIWYRHILINGYVSAIPPVSQNQDLSNVAFFPGYPLFGKLIVSLTGASPDLGLILASHLAALAFWIGFFLLMREWRVRGWCSWLSALVVGVYPSSFYLMVAYSESLYLACFIGFFLGATLLSQSSSRRLRRSRQVFTSVCGICFSLTRVTGLVVVALPLFVPGIRIKKAVSIAMSSCMGAFSFFAYCQWRWQAWDLYFWTQKVSWAVAPRFKALLMPSTYLGIKKVHWLEALKLSPHGINRFTPIFMVLLFSDFAISEWQRFGRSVSRVRMWLWSGAVLSFFVALAGSWSVNFNGLSRYSLLPFMLLVLAYTHRSTEQVVLNPDRGTRWRSTIGAGILALYLVYSICAQGSIARLFLRARWMG